MLALFVPGILELLIIAFMLGIPLIVVFIVLAIQRRTGTDQSKNPNLRPCPDCGHYISLRANICPQCGGPVKSV